MASSKNSPANEATPDAVQLVRQVISAQLTGSAGATQLQYLVGFSGGLDSTVLLHAASTVIDPAALIAVHVNHRLQPAADHWALHCEEVANTLGVNFRCEVAQSPPVQFLNGLENWARDQRRAAFVRASQASGIDTVLLAHHQDDQVETVLWHLARGAGPDGMAGMRESSHRDGMRILRPLLSVPQQALNAYAAHFALPVIDDPSNTDTAHTRNRIRHDVLPQLNQSFPGFDQSLLRVAANAADVSDALRLSLFDGEPPVELSRRDLQSRPVVLARQMLRFWLRARGATMPDRHALLNWLPQLVDGDGAYAQIEHGELLICRYRDRIFLLPAGRQADAVRSESVPLRWTGQDSITLEDYSGQLRFTAVATGELAVLTGDLMSESLSVSPMHMSARIRPQPAGPSRRIKQLCQERAISRWERRFLPMLWLGDKPLFVAGLGMNADCLKPVGATDRGVRVHWHADT